MTPSSRTPARTAAAPRQADERALAGRAHDHSPIPGRAGVAGRASTGSASDRGSPRSPRRRLYLYRIDEHSWGAAQGGREPVGFTTRGGTMAAIDDLTELVEGAAVAEKTALSSKWKNESDVQGLIRRTRKAAEEQRQAISLDTDAHRLSPRWAGLRQNYLDLGAQPALPGQEPSAHETSDDSDHGARRLSYQAAAQAEHDAVAAVGVARMALTDAALAVLQARLARIQAGEDQPESVAVDGHVPLRGHNAVSRHGPALAHGLTG